MIYSKSIYKQFHQKLIFATSIFIVTLSFIFYGYTKATIYEDIKDGLLQDAKLIYKVSKESKFQDATFNVITLGDVNVDIIALEDVNEIKYINFRQNDDYYVQLLYPFDLEEKNLLKLPKILTLQEKCSAKFLTIFYF